MSKIVSDSESIFASKMASLRRGRFITDVDKRRREYISQRMTEHNIMCDEIQRNSNAGINVN